LRFCVSKNSLVWPNTYRWGERQRRWLAALLPLP
jgi:hypothetical protein